jgi:glucokinase
VRILTMDIGGTMIKSSMFDDKGCISDVRETPSRTVNESSLIVNAVSVADGYADFKAVGIAMTGQIDPRNQTLLFEYGKRTTAAGAGIPIGQMLSDAIKKPVFLLNDANAAALGEAKFGAGTEYDDFICLTYGTGVGGGIILGSRLYTGRRGIAGEFGHMVIHAGSGKLCGCGRRGCYEAYASVTALLKNAKRIQTDIRDGKDLFDQARQQPELRRVIFSWIREIVEGLCTLCYIFNPPCIILGGGIMERPEVIEMVRKRFVERIIPTFSQVNILPALLGNQAGLYGAYAYAQECMKKQEDS